MAPAKSQIELRINTDRLAAGLWAFVLLLVVLGVVVALLETATEVSFHPSIREFFNLESERSFGNWFSTLLLFVGGLTSLVAARAFPERTTRRLWVLLGVILIVLSADEAVSLHERAGLGATLSGVFTFAWVIPATVGVLVLGGLYVFRFFPRLPAALRRSLVAAAAVYVLGALGVEFLEGAITSGDLFGVPGVDTVAYQLTAALQETMEMVGLVLFVTTLLRWLRSASPMTISL